MGTVDILKVRAADSAVLIFFAKTLLLCPSMELFFRICMNSADALPIP